MAERKSQDLIILTSPPASGKTYWISRFKEVQHSRLLVISPLRALADECKDKWGESVDVMTPEEWMMKKVQSPVVIFDEFHLLFYWGDSFRPLMWEVFYELAMNSELMILLTATFAPFMQEEVKKFWPHFDQIIWVDNGNQCLKFRPHFYLKGPNRRWIMRQIETESPDTGVKLIFCEYREEVFQVEKRLHELGFKVVSCVGGEASLMKSKLRHNPRPDFIVATTVLSHGVNLPEISKVYFLYPVENLDFWIQMVARGGRRGERFEVYALEIPKDLHWNPCKNFFHLLWINLKNSFQIQEFARDMRLFKK